MELTGRSSRGKRVWKPETKFKFRFRKKGNTCVTTLSISSIYKFGIKYSPVYCKWKGKEDRIIGIKGEGYIIASNYRRYDKVYYRYIMDLRILVRKVAQARIVNTELVKYITHNGKILTRENRDYILKPVPHKHFENMLGRNRSKKLE